MHTIEELSEGTTIKVVTAPDNHGDDKDDFVGKVYPTGQIVAVNDGPEGLQNPMYLIEADASDEIAEYCKTVKDAAYNPLLELPLAGPLGIFLPVECCEVCS